MHTIPASAGIVDGDAYWSIETNDLLGRLETLRRAFPLPRPRRGLQNSDETLRRRSQARRRWPCLPASSGAHWS